MVRRNRKSRKHVAGVKSGRTYKNLVGTRAEIMHGTAFKTSYGRTKSQGGDALTKINLKYNKHGRIVSIAKSNKKAQLLNQLRVAGYTTKKGKFGAVKIGKTLKKHRKKRKGRKRHTSGKSRRCRHKSGTKKGKFKKC